MTQSNMEEGRIEVEAREQNEAAPEATDANSKAKSLSILHIVPSMHPAHGGVSAGVANYQRIGREHGHNVEIVTMDSPDEAFIRDLGPFHALGQRRPAWARFLPWRRYGYEKSFVPWLRKNARRYDVIVVNAMWNYAALGTRLALTGGNVPYVVFTHGMLDPWFSHTYPVKALIKQGFWWFSEGPLLNGASFVLFTSQEELELARHSFRPYRVHGRVVGFGAEDAPADPQGPNQFILYNPSLQGRKYLLFMSRIHPKKGCDLLLEAFARIASAYPELDLVIAGPDQVGWRSQLERQAESNGLSGRVHWPGMLTGAQKWGALRSAEAFVLPSHQENFGVVVAEAMAAGTPVLTTLKVNIWREVERSGAGLVETNTAAGVERLLTRFLQMQPEVRSEMRNSARAAFLANFQIESATRALESVLFDAISQRSGVSHA